MKTNFKIGDTVWFTNKFGRHVVGTYEGESEIPGIDGPIKGHSVRSDNAFGSGATKDVLCFVTSLHAKGVTRYVATYVDRKGQRTLMQARQGRYTYATAEEAQAWIDAVTKNNSADTVRSIWGDNPRFEVRPCPCWPNHFDPQTCWFD